MNKNSFVKPKDEILLIVKKTFLPYIDYLNQIQEILFWERPLTFIFILIIFNFLILYSYFKDMGFFGFITLLITLFYLISILFNRFGNFLTKLLFPPNKIVIKLYSFDEISEIITLIFFNFLIFLDFIFGTEYEIGLFKIGYIAFVWGLLTLFFNYFGSFWILLIILNILIVLPGFLFKNYNNSKLHKD